MVAGNANQLLQCEEKSEQKLSRDEELWLKMADVNIKKGKYLIVKSISWQNY